MSDSRITHVVLCGPMHGAFNFVETMIAEFKDGIVVLFDGFPPTHPDVASVGCLDEYQGVLPATTVAVFDNRDLYWVERTLRTTQGHIGVDWRAWLSRRFLAEASAVHPRLVEVLAAQAELNPAA